MQDNADDLFAETLLSCSEVIYRFILSSSSSGDCLYTQHLVESTVSPCFHVPRSENVIVLLCLMSAVSASGSYELHDIADVYETLGKFLSDLSLFAEVHICPCGTYQPSISA